MPIEKADASTHPETYKNNLWQETTTIIGVSCQARMLQVAAEEGWVLTVIDVEEVGRAFDDRW